ncbi:GAF domain-containing protein [Methylocapsa sp. S129]|uniref:bifunctional diguanylate cyclase/phosphodiesterase n=1 Tax=Methylocapsa sp. S129 TaxID=1641869 RepID=UPI00131AB657|nr:GAF domain-containing protein [Methylocapsa sp. S129]
MTEHGGAGRMFAILKAASEAVLRATSREELFQSVCDAAVLGGDIACVSVLLADPGAKLRFVAGAGDGVDALRALNLSADGVNPVGEAPRAGLPNVGEAYSADKRVQAWLEEGRRDGVSALVPILRRGSPIGVFAFRANLLNAPSEQTADLMGHIAEAVSSALDNFDRERERGRVAEANHHLDRRFRLLNATNKAILRARSADEMFQIVCDAATGPGKLLGASITLYNPNSPWFTRVAYSGAVSHIYEKVTISADPGLPEGQGVAGGVFRTGEPCFIDDVPNDPRTARWRSLLLAEKVTTGAVLPLMKGGRIVGVCSFYFGEDSGPWDDERIQLTTQISENISFGLEMFERQDQKDNVTRMFAALSATNEAIMRAQTRAELFELVCEAAAKGGKFTATLIGLAEPGSDFLRIAASAGPTAATSKSARLAITAAHPEGRGLTGQAFRAGRPCISNDYLAEIEESVLKETVRNEGTKSGAALPLLNQGNAVGVLLFMSSERDAFTPELVALLKRLAQNISFALENFDRADSRSLAEEQKERFARMFAALSATNEAIMRARTRDELFQRVSKAAAQGGKFTSTVIALADPGVDFLRIVAAAGPTAALSRTLKLAVTEAYPEGRGLSGTAFRTRQPCISNDYAADKRSAARRDRARTGGAKSCAALPLLARGAAVGILLFFSSEQGAFTPELVELLQKLAENVSFALENFDRADDRRLADDQRERLTRMFAALSATNEAIMRAGTRAELFQLVCEAAVHGGRFASTIIALTEPANDFLRVVASAGPKGDMQKTVRIAITEAHPEGCGVSGTAFRTLQPCIINDYLADQRGSAFHERARREGNKSGAALPLLSGGRAVGVLVFMSSERNAFTPELVELLLRLANNVSFALDNFNRADEKAQADERIKYLATHDGLTDLPNRAMFNQLLHFSIEAARRYARKFAVLFIDIDRFKVINDSLGHDAGDTLLIEIGARLRQSLRAGDVVARLGGDEFVIILEQASQAQQVEAAARKLLSVVAQPLQLCGLECRATASIGIAMFPHDGEDELTLTKNADLAMYRAKEEGKNGFRFFTSQDTMPSVERLVFEARLRQALDRDEFSLHYQPKVDVATDQITGVEALLRWTLPDLGTLPPMQFIPLAEETGLIVPIGRWVLNKACAQNMAWRRQGLAPLSMAVNLSPRQFSDENLLQDIDDALAASGMPPQFLQLEITESMVMHNVGRAIELLDIIRARGVRLAIDDFGTGYSSMALMKKFPVDTLKIDRSFVQDLPQDSEDRAIAQAIISMGKALGMTVIAEGVETVEQAAFLREHGCDEMQGYLFSRPVPAEGIAELLDANRLLAPPLQPRAAIGGPARRRREGGNLALAPQRKRL